MEPVTRLTLTRSECEAAAMCLRRVADQIIAKQTMTPKLTRAYRELYALAGKLQPPAAESQVVRTRVRVEEVDF